MLTEKDTGNFNSELPSKAEPVKGNPGQSEAKSAYTSPHSQQFYPLPQSNNAHDARMGTQQYSSTPYKEQTTTTELAKFLARSHLVTGGLNKYDDRPENYLSWKSTFLSTIEGLDLTTNEEIDLLIKWLGEQARRIKDVNIRCTAAGLNMIWS